MSWFKRKRNSNDMKRQPIEQLATLLREHGNAILENNATLCLTTPVLISLNQQFEQLNLRRSQNGSENSDFQVILAGDSDKDIALVFDFVQKSPNLKLESGPVCSASPQLCLLPFKSIQFLDIRRVPIAYLRGLHHIAKHLKFLTCHRSASSIKDVIYQFGKDFNGILTLPELKTLDLSYNTITSLDQSLTHLPWLQSLDLCYNCLVDASSEFIPPIKLLNLGFNSITTVPVYSQIASRSITYLVLCNNNLTNLKGLESFVNLQTLDVSSNCIICFDELLPLARLQFLLFVTLKGNPVEFMPKYRLEVISRLSPIVRVEPISLDGELLTEMEMLSLGLFVQPPPLLSYIPKKPIGRRPERATKTVDPVRILHEREPISSSTPNNIHRKAPSRRRGRVREADILDRGAPASIAKSQDSNGSINRSVFEREGSFGSRRDSVDASILWIHKTSSGELIEVSKSLPHIDYAAQLESEQLTNTLGTDIHSADDIIATNDSHGSIYNKKEAKFDIDDSSSVSSDSSISIVTDNDDAPVYLVESVIGVDKDSTEEKESVFVILKHPYLIEKDPVTGQIVKLDLNYLNEVAPFPNGVLRVSLKFDLIRTDRRKRLYLFEDIDHVKEFNEFVSHLKPVVLRNKKIREASLEQFQCLKCSAKFQNAKSETSFSLCPNCKSSMVIQQYSDPEARTDSGTNIEDKSLIKDCSADLSNIGLQANSYLPRENSSFEVLARFGDSNLSHVANVIEESNGLLPEKVNDISPTATLPQSDNFSNGIHQAGNGMVQNVESSNQKKDCGSNNLAAEDEKDSVDGGGQSIEDAYENDNNSDSFKGSVGKLKFYLKNKISGRQTPERPLGERIIGSEANATSTPSTSYGSKNTPSRDDISRTVTPVQEPSNTCFITNKDELDRCNHRLKLYFAMDLFSNDNEDFRCMIQCQCIRFDKKDVDDCLLVASTHNIYLFRFKSNESDAPKKWLHLIVKYGFFELKYIEYCYHNQSFRLEFERDYGAYKFLVCDSERCQKYLSLLLNAIEDVVTDKQNLPVVCEDPNPRTLINIRTQIFGLKESLFSMAKHIYVEATKYTVPSLLKSRKVRIRTHHQSVTGKELVSWLVSRREAKSRLEAISLCQKFVDHGFLYHISKEFQFQDGDIIYKFCFSDTNKKTSFSALQQSSFESNDSGSSQTSLEEVDISSDVCLYAIADVRMSIEESLLKRQSIFLTKSHLFIVTESHQWPLARIYQPPAFLREQFNVIGKQRVIELVKMTLFEDSPCHVLLEFVDELGDEESRETSWLIQMETVREVNKLTNTLKSIWESEIKVEITVDVWPSVHLAF